MKNLMFIAAVLASASAFAGQKNDLTSSQMMGYIESGYQICVKSEGQALMSLAMSESCGSYAVAARAQVSSCVDSAIASLKSLGQGMADAGLSASSQASVMSSLMDKQVLALELAGRRAVCASTPQ